jgi:radical SAM superfamily enzyme YgiQ (UPF0313 family)
MRTDEGAPAGCDNVRRCDLIEITAMPHVRYSVTLGYLEAAARLDPIVGERYEFHRHVLFQEPGRSGAICAQLLERIEEPAVVALTVYFWNRAVSLQAVAAIKQRWPQCTVVVGGNDVSYQAAALFSEAPQVDVLVHGEGELRFAALLRALLEGTDLGAISGITYRGPDGLIETPPAPRIADLDEVPSPLLSGVYGPEDLADSSMIVYETNRGCPYSCAFCYWGGATNSRVRRFPMERIEAELEMIVRHVAPGTVLFIADANFGLYPRDEDIADHLIRLCQRYDKRLMVMTNWAKKTSDRVLEIATKLYRAGLTGAITLSAQSFDQTVLDIAHRSNIRLEQYRRLQSLFLERGIPTYTDLIWGLPGETTTSFMAGVEECIAVGGSPVIYPLVLLNNTEYTTARFRLDHDLRTRRLPSDLSNPEMMADVVIGHRSMTEDEWLWGIQLRFALSVYYKALLRATMWSLHRHAGVRFVDLIERLRALLFEEGEDPVLRAVTDDYVAGIRTPGQVRGERAAAVVGRGAITEEIHYQAVLQRLVTGAVGQDLIRRAAQAMLEVVPTASRPSPEEFEAVLALDLAAVSVLRARLRRVPPSADFDVAAADWELLRSAGQLPFGAPEVSRDRAQGSFAVPSNVAHYPFTSYALAIWHGSAHPLRDGLIELNDSMVVTAG